MMIEALGRGIPESELPLPAWAKGSKLACYPADRSPAGYSQTEIDLFAEYLCRRFAVVVVDLANHMPEIGDPAGEAVSYWLEHADAVMLPTTASQASFNGVLDYLDLPDLPPVVVAYIAPNDRKARKHPVNHAYLEEIGAKVCDIVEFPFESGLEYADYEKTAVIDVTPALRQAYWRLTEAIIRVPRRAEGGDRPAEGGY
jgi:hypothetical protein